MEIVRRHSAEEADFTGVRALMLNTNHTADDAPSLYEAARHAWRIDRRRAERVDVILATRNGIILEAFVADRWVPADREHFPGREPVPGRWGFEGRRASGEMRRRFVRKRVPNRYRQQGAANPVKYSW